MLDRFLNWLLPPTKAELELDARADAQRNARLKSNEPARQFAHEYNRRTAN